MPHVSMPEVECESQHATLNVSDIGAAVEFYTTTLGFRLGFTWGEPPTFAGVLLGKVQMFLRRGTPNPQGCAVNFDIADVDELFAFQQVNGVEVIEPPGDRPYGMRDYRVRDLYGYELGFGQPLFNMGAPIEIERIDVPVRLERRLAGLLQDLAVAKRMSVSSCLEETLLHTLDGVGPHTEGQLRQIARLKEKHGIDYDTHASYRFVERSGAEGPRSDNTTGRGAVALLPFVPSGRDFDGARRLFADLGFTEVWAQGDLAGFRSGEAQFILQNYDVRSFAENFMITLRVSDLDAWWHEVSQLGLEKKYPGFRINPPADQPWGREVVFIDPAGVCWHVVKG